MKNLKKWLGGIVVLFAMIMILQAPMDAKASNGFYQVDSTSSTVTVSWSKYVPTYGVFNRYEIEDSYGNYLWSTTDQNITSATIYNLEAGAAGSIRLYGYFTNSSGYTTYGYYASATINTLPEKVSKFYVSYADSDKKAVSVSVSKPYYATGIKVFLYNAATGKYIKSKTGTGYVTLTGVKNNYGYKYRVRAYYKNTDNGKTYWGPYSSYKYFDNLTGKTITGSSYKNSFGLKLYKGTGIKYYVLYMSKKSDSGFKKTATLKVSGKSKLFKITKYGSSALKGGNTYYYKVVPKIKVGSSTKTSEIKGNGSLYIWR